MSKSKHIIGKKITHVAVGYSFIELTTEDGVMHTFEVSDKKSTKYQDNPDIVWRVINNPELMEE